MFSLRIRSALGRRGRLMTQHGVIETPFFMPVGTAGAMKGLTHGDLLDLDAQVLLCNTYHLHIQPGEDVVAAAGGLHGFTGWPRPILTDSGGFQVFSLRGLRRVSDAGVEFRSHRDGSLLQLDPERAIRIQHALGADIIMCLDECPPSTAPREQQIAAVDRTLKWARRCREEHHRLIRERQAACASAAQEGSSSAHAGAPGPPASSPLLFGIIQGGLERDLRRRCAEELLAMGFDGYAIGGLAVGETEEEMFGVLQDIVPLLPEDKPRYLMGVGDRAQMRTAVAKGIDMFDCVMPMREARHGTVFLSDGSSIRILRSEFRTAHEPIDPLSPSVLGRTHLRSYLHHLFKAGERLGETIACHQNLGVTLATMRTLRAEIEQESERHA